MGRAKVLFGFWLVGYALGFLAWTIKNPVLVFIERLGLSPDAAGALIMGLVSSSVMVVGVLVWSFLSTNSS